MEISDICESSQLHVPLTYVDFVPENVSPNKGLFDTTQYERVDVLVNKANAWLKKHAHMKVVRCESYELTKTRKSASTNVVVALYETKDKYLRCLRLWVASKTSADDLEPQQVRYMNFTPNYIESEGNTSKPKFESFEDIVSRINGTIQHTPLPGRIINVETGDMKVHSNGAPDPDETSWTQGLSYLRVIRIFFLVGKPAHEQIGCADFVPKMTKPQGLASFAQFVPFSIVIQQADAYIHQNPGLRILNVESVNYKLHSSLGNPIDLDTQRVDFHDRSWATHYLRIVRVYHVSSAYDTGVPVRTLTCKTFLPCRTSKRSLVVAPKFETQDANMMRAMAWLKATGARIISSETAAIPVRSGYNAENPYTYFTHSETHLVLMVFRVYLDGDYPEPSPKTLPPRPELTAGCTPL